MLFCRHCGQCALISSDQFIQYVSVSGSETRFLNAETAEVEDYGDSDLDRGEEIAMECPHCNGEDVARGWSGTEDQALNLRKQYDDDLADIVEGQKKRAALHAAQASAKKTGWDIESNEVFK